MATVSAQSFHCPDVLLPDGWRQNQTIDCDADGRIITIRPAQPQPADQQLKGVVVPGMVNAHSHIHQRLIAGLTGQRGDDGDSFWSWRERMYAALGLIDGEDFTLLAEYGFMELLEGGYTSTGEFHYPHRLAGQAPLKTSRQLLAAGTQAGCALTLLPVWYRYGGFGRQPLGERQRDFGLSLDELVALVETLTRETGNSHHRLGVAPHSLRAVDARDLPELLARLPDCPLHLHISEQPAEVEACLEAHGCRPVEWLLDNVKADQRFSLIHATHASPSERQAMAASGAAVVICPTTEADLGDGLFPVREYLDRGGHIAIGSDSNLVTSAAEELRLLEWGQRLRLGQRNLLGRPGEHIASALWQSLAAEGARALNQPAGELRVGRRADFLVLNPAHPLLSGLPAAEQLDSFVFAHQAGMIDQVWVAGEQVVHGGQHRQRAELDERMAQLRRRLVERSTRS